ncbi:MAG: leucine-rich repeat protein, partial [Clostridiales bacterium]|nr:leucine-rich repeat protein [Clostridiales bacterium]
MKKFTEEHRKARRAVALLLALAMVVATGVSWQLHATGIALTNETYCGLEEHTHNEDCYASVLVCGLEESEGHTHSEDCYETETTLVCGLEESEGHTHTEDCYDEDGNLICGKEESEGHTHTDACYETETVLVCGQEESEGHTHTEDCYEEQLVCGLEEHTHTVDCLTDETADVETASVWEATLPDLTGIWAEDVVAVAESQLGYTESTANFTLADDGETRQGYTRYGAWYGNAYGDWDAMFASFCLYYAGVDEEDFPEASGAYAWSVELNKLGLYEDAADTAPISGDLVFFDTDEDGKADHVGVVTEVNEKSGKLTVIEGDCEDAVTKNTYAADDSTIIGYGTVAEAQGLEDEDSVAEESVEAEAETEAESEAESEIAAEAESADESEVESENESESEAETETEDGATLTQQTLTATVDSATITVSGLLPEGAAVTATPVEVENDELNIVLAFDISIYNADGTVFEPEDDTISVTIQSDEISAGNGVYYISDDGDAEKMESEAEEGAVAFDAEHFSVYVVTSSDTVVATGTIDDADGNTNAITWTIYEDETGTRTLVFSGTGAIPNYKTGTETPWYSYAYNSYTGVDKTTHKGLNLVIEDGITRIGDYAFRNGYYLSLDIGADVESIGKYAFWYVHSLTSVSIPGSVKTIENYAFFTCYDLASVTLEEGVESIGTWAFGYDGLDVSYTVYLPSSVTYVGGGAFLNASGYAFQESASVTTTSGCYQTNGTYTIVDGVLYSADFKTLPDYPSKRIADSYTILVGTTTVQGSALSYITGTKEIVVASTVASYGGTTYVFQHSSGLESVIFENGAYANAAYMFYSCENLQSVTLPDTEGLSLGTDYFYGCSSLESIT